MVIQILNDKFRGSFPTRRKDVDFSLTHSR